MPKTTEKTADQTLPLEGFANQAAETPIGALTSPARDSGRLERMPAASTGLSDTVALIQMMERIAKNKEVDVEKMKVIEDMQRRLMSERRENEFNIAMAEAQAEMEPVRADAANDETHSKFASHAALDRALRPIYTKHGFALTFTTEPHPVPEMMTFVCFATARGFTRRYPIDLPVDGKGPKGGNVMSRTHAASSGVTYSMRILLKMIFNIAVDRDDDGNAAGKTVKTDDRPKISPKQIDQIIDLCDAKGCPRAKFLSHIGIATFKDIPAVDFDAHIALINSYGPKHG